MKRVTKIAPMVLISLLAAGTAWACRGNNSSAQAEAKGCPYKAEARAQAASCPVAPQAAHAKLAGAGSHCDGVGKSAEAMAHDCGLRAGQATYAFAVPGAECEHCIQSIQKAALAMKGVDCAHVDLKTHTAYIIADKGVSQKAIAKCIRDAGFKNTYRGTGPKIQAAFVDAMKDGAKNGMSCCPAEKAKDKV